MDFVNKDWIFLSGSYWYSIWRGVGANSMQQLRMICQVAPACIPLAESFTLVVVAFEFFCSTGVYSFITYCHEMTAVHTRLVVHCHKVSLSTVQGNNSRKMCTILFYNFVFGNDYTHLFFTIILNFNILVIAPCLLLYIKV